MKTAEAEIMVHGYTSVSDIVKIDVFRQHRTGIMEAVLAEGKNPADVVKIANAQIAASGRVLITRISEEHRALLLKTSNSTSVVHDGTPVPVTGRLQSCSVLPVVNIGAAAGKGKTQTIGKGGISL